jgi:ABC-type hemin transport system ATPase subunit
MHLAHDGRSRPLLEAHDVSVRRCGHSLLQRVSITADRGELLVLLGDAGSGTDTLLDLLGGLASPDAGRVLRDGRVPLGIVSDHTGGVPVARGPEQARARLADHLAADAESNDVVLLLDEPTKGLDDDAAHLLLAACRGAANDGRAVVVTSDRADLAAAHATTIALFVAGRLLSWGTPAIALVPAFQLLSAGARRSG